MSKAKAKPKGKTVYLVVRLALTLGHNGSIYPCHGTYDEDAREVPVRAFASQRAAEQFAYEQNAECCRVLTPPLLQELTGLPDEPINELLLEMDLPPIPPPRRGEHPGRGFHRWWAEHAANLSTKQRKSLEGMFSAAVFHTVRPVRVEG